MASLIEDVKIEEPIEGAEEIFRLRIIPNQAEPEESASGASKKKGRKAKGKGKQQETEEADEDGRESPTYVITGTPEEIREKLKKKAQVTNRKIKRQREKAIVDRLKERKRYEEAERAAYKEAKEAERHAGSKAPSKRQRNRSESSSSDEELPPYRHPDRDVFITVIVKDEVDHKFSNASQPVQHQTDSDPIASGPISTSEESSGTSSSSVDVAVMNGQVVLANNSDVVGDMSQSSEPQTHSETRDTTGAEIHTENDTSDHTDNSSSTQQPQQRVENQADLIERLMGLIEQIQKCQSDGGQVRELSKREAQVVANVLLSKAAKNPEEKVSDAASVDDIQAIPDPPSEEEDSMPDGEESDVENVFDGGIGGSPVAKVSKPTQKRKASESEEIQPKRKIVTEKSDKSESPSVEIEDSDDSDFGAPSKGKGKKSAATNKSPVKPRGKPAAKAKSPPKARKSPVKKVTQRAADSDNKGSVQPRALPPRRCRPVHFDADECESLSRTSSRTSSSTEVDENSDCIDASSSSESEDDTSQQPQQQEGQADAPGAQVESDPMQIGVNRATTADRPANKISPSTGKKSTCEPLTYVGRYKDDLDKGLVDGHIVWTCKRCPKSYDKQTAAIGHVLTHKPPGFSCRHCDKKISHPSNYRQHLLTHQNASPRFKCRQCGKSFNRRYHLNLHTYTHTNARFPCDQCEADYSNRNNLRMHKVLSHSGKVVPKHKCEQCGKMFVLGKNLRQHLGGHADPTHFCDECPSQFHSKGGLTRHKREKHSTN